MKLGLTHIISPEVEGEAKILLTVEDGFIRIEKERVYVTLSHNDFKKVHETYLSYMKAVEALQS